jgi:hypothetical protein
MCREEGRERKRERERERERKRKRILREIYIYMWPVFLIAVKRQILSKVGGQSDFDFF